MRSGFFFISIRFCRQQEWAGVIAQQMDLEKHTIVLCHHGMRSNMVWRFSLQNQALNQSRHAGSAHARVQAEQMHGWRNTCT